jgi:hypothetical protein
VLQQRPSRALLRLAWQFNQNAYHAFVERAAGDHKEHKSLTELLDVGDWVGQPAASARLAADTLPLLRRSDHPALKWIFARLERLQGAPSDAEINEVVAIAQFRSTSSSTKMMPVGRTSYSPAC